MVVQRVPFPQLALAEIVDEHGDGALPSAHYQRFGFQEERALTRKR